MSQNQAAPTPEQWATAVLAGDRRAAARLISRVEATDADAGPAIARLYAAGAGAPVIGITGPPGAGKSTLIDQLIARWRARAWRIGALSIDPASPVSGGAILGDRLRMNRHNTDSGVFIRSMSSRGHLGGIASATGDALIVLDALRFDRLIVETVGTGQNEIDILNHADTVVVLQTPAGGDAVQTMKAGLLEIADVLVVNQMDAPGADRMVAALRDSLSERSPVNNSWSVPVIKTQAVDGSGVAELDDALQAHASHWERHPTEREIRRRRRVRAQILGRLAESLRRGTEHGLGQQPHLDALVEDVVMRRRDPAGAVDDLIRRFR